MTTVSRHALILTLLAVVMASTRLHHFAPVPDASWAVFFVAGFYLRDWARWAFPALMALAVLVDYLAISAQGISFWSAYCMSPAYWALIPAHFVLWSAGSWLRRHHAGNDGRALAMLAASLVVAVVACHLVAQGSFYWMSSSVANPDLAGWWKNFSDWLPAYLGVTALYVGIAAGVHVVATQRAGQRAAARIGGR